MDLSMAAMRAGVERGWVLPKVVLDGYESTITSHIVDDPEQSVLYAPFESFPVGVAEGEQERLRRDGAEAIAESVVPAYRAFHEFFVHEYLPACSDFIAASERPGGTDYYAQRVRFFTTLDPAWEGPAEL